MKTFLAVALVLVFPAWKVQAEAPEARVASWVETQGGDVVRDKEGRIIEVSLARTWAGDAGLERVFELKNLKRLDLSLTYFSDHGAERLPKLEQLEELNLFAAEFITDAAIALDRKSTRLNSSHSQISY